MPPKKARFGNRGGSKAGIGKGGKCGRYDNYRKHRDYDRGYGSRSIGGMADTTTGVAIATEAPGTMVDKVMTDGALAPMAHPLRTQGTVIVLSHR